jgi:transcriptional regulator with XRE-family HTH domain
MLPLGSFLSITENHSEPMAQSASLLFRERIRELRRLKNLTQAEAAEICGLGDKMFQQYEVGIKTNPGLLTLEKISRGFGIELHELLAPELPATITASSRKPRAKRKRIAR